MYLVPVLILGLWAAASVFVAWVALARYVVRWREQRKIDRVKTHEELLAAEYPDLAPQ